MFINLRNQNWTLKHKVAFSFILGAISSLTMPPTYIFILLGITYPLFIKTLDNLKTKKESFYVAWSFGFGYFTLSLYWISFALLVDVQSFFWVIPFAIVGLPAVLSIFYGVAGFFYSVVAPKSISAKILTFSCLFSLIEIARSFLFTGFPWNLPGHSLIFSQEIAQILSYIGIYGLTFLAFLLGAMCLSRKGIAIAIIIIINLFIFGAYRLNTTDLKHHEEIELALIQPNIDQAKKWEKAYQNENFNTLISLSKQAIEKRDAKANLILIWPETALTFFPDIYPHQNRGSKDKISAIETLLLTHDNVSLITGGIDFERTQQGKFKTYNSIFLVETQNSIALNGVNQESLGIEKSISWSRYDKSHLVPFGEYLPFGEYVDFLPIGGTGFTAGTNTNSFKMTSIHSNQTENMFITSLFFKPLICYEALFSNSIFNTTQDYNKTEIIVNLTNDAWYRDSLGPYQHHDFVKIRAIEHGIPFIRVANTGISSLTNPLGGTETQSLYGEKKIILSKMPKKLQNATFYAFYNMQIMIILILTNIAIPLLFMVKKQK